MRAYNLIHVLNVIEKKSDYQILLIRKAISVYFICSADVNYIHFAFQLVFLRIKNIEQISVKKPILIESLLNNLNVLIKIHYKY